MTVPRVAVTGGVDESDCKNTTSRRTLPLPPDEVTALRAAWDRKLAEQKRQGRRYRECELLACSVGGVPRHPDTLSKDWKALLAGAGLSHVRLHDARHTCASRLLVAGVDPATVAAWLGHANAATTLRVYAHTNPKRLAAVAEAFHARPEQGGGVGDQSSADDESPGDDESDEAAS